MKQSDTLRLVNAQAGTASREVSSRDGLDAFLASVERRAFVMARLSTRDDDVALDIVQDAMLRMVRTYAHKPARDLPPLFFRILANRLTDHHRKRGFARLLRWRGFGQDGEEGVADAVDQLPHESPEPDEALDANLIGVAVRRALLELPERQRQVFMLRQWQGMSVAETAQALGISGGSVKTHLSRALQALRTHLQEFASDETD